MDLWPLVEEAASRHGVPAELLLALCKAESGLAPRAWREGPWPDVSGGLTQITVALAGALGLGDGSAAPANVRLVRAALEDRATALDLGARYLAECLAAANGDWLLALRRYNGGAYGLTSDYERRYASNLAAYRRALEWARSVVG